MMAMINTAQVELAAVPQAKLQQSISKSALAIVDRAIEAARCNAKNACIAAGEAYDAVDETHRALVSARIARDTIAANLLATPARPACR